MLTSQIIEREEDLLPIRREWDDLACSAALPYGSPAWMLGWWRHLAPVGAQLRVDVVHDGADLVGLAAMYVAQEEAGARHTRLLAARYGGTPLGPLAVPGRESEVARVIVTALAAARPRIHAVHLDGVPATSPWPGLLRDAWPGRIAPLLQRQARRPLPTVDLVGTTFEAWMAAKSANFRQTLRRRRRQLEDQGAVVRMSSTVQEALGDLQAFTHLHESRWEWRGGSGRLRPSTEAFLADLARELLPEGRFRLWSIDLDGEPISSHLFVCGGGRANYWLGGFDDRFARYSPAMVTLLAAIEHAWSVGDRSVGLGAGRQGYKGRFTEDAVDLDWVQIVPPGSVVSPKAWIGMGPAIIGSGVRNHVSPKTRERISAATRRTSPKDER